MKSSHAGQTMGYNASVRQNLPFHAELFWVNLSNLALPYFSFTKYLCSLKQSVAT